MERLLDVENQYEKLLFLANSNYLLYHDLEDMELEGKNNGLEFRSVVESIKNNKNMEEDIYNDARYNKNNLEALFFHANTGRVINIDSFKFEDIITALEVENIKMRILYYLQEQVLIKKYITNKDFVKEGRIIFDNYLFVSAIDNDLLMALFNICNDYIDDEKDMDVKRVLINAKYRIVFLNDFIERFLLENDFKYNDRNINFTHPIVFSSLPIDKKIVDNTYKKYCEKIMEKQIEKIVFGRRNNSLVIRKAIITALLLFFEECEVSNILNGLLVTKEQFKGLIDEEIFNKFVLDSFKEYEKYRVKVRKISI